MPGAPRTHPMRVPDSPNAGRMMPNDWGDADNGGSKHFFLNDGSGRFEQSRTRTFATGEPGEDLRALYDLVERAQAAALEALQRTLRVDRAAILLFDDAAVMLRQLTSRTCWRRSRFREVRRVPDGPWCDARTR
mgnify:CR=1 FL=1